MKRNFEQRRMVAYLASFSLTRGLQRAWLASMQELQFTAKALDVLYQHDVKWSSHIYSREGCELWQ